MTFFDVLCLSITEVMESTASLAISVIDDYNF